MARKTKEELNALCKKFNVPVLDSWSKYHCYKQDKYEFFLKYVLHKPEDRNNGIYAESGGQVHDILEKFYTDQIKYKDMIDLYEDALLTMNLAELKYNRSDSEKNERIANKYENCIRHFFTHHNVVTNPHVVEKFITIQICDDVVLQGYIDFLYTSKEDGEPKISIIDFKTSSLYRGEKIDKESGQLLIYAEGIRQLTSVDLKDIYCGWNFLKYINVTYEQKNGKNKTRIIERHAIGESLVNTVKMWLKHFGYEEDRINDYIEDMILNNNLDSLPLDVREKFTFDDCYVEVPLTEERIENLKNDIADAIHESREKTKEYNKLKEHDKDEAEMLFWQEVTDADAFRLATLSNYSRTLHKPYDEYLKNKEIFENNTKDKEESQEEQDLLDFLNSL